MRATDQMPALPRLLVDLNLLHEVLEALPGEWSAELEGRARALLSIYGPGALRIIVRPGETEAGDFQWLADDPKRDGLACGSSLVGCVALLLAQLGRTYPQLQVADQTWAETVADTVSSYSAAVDVQLDRRTEDTL